MHAVIAAFALLALLAAAVAAVVDPAQSSIVCPASVVAGHPAACTVTLHDSGGLPAATNGEACGLFLTRCLTTDTEFTNRYEPLSNATALGSSVFRFVFNPVVAGTLQLNLRFTDTATTTFAIPAAPPSITVTPATVFPGRSNSTCSTSAGVTQCTMEHRDAFGNVVSSCVMHDVSGDLLAAPVCTQL